MQKLPTISLVTPSYNQGGFIEETIKSVLAQKYDNLEYIIIDGKSSDGAVEIIDKYKNDLSYYISENDRGQYDAINKGFSKSTGDIMAWINSDDVYLPNTLSLVGRIFAQFEEVEWLTTRYPAVIDENGNLIKLQTVPGFSRHGFLCGDNLPASGWQATSFIQQESTFWRRSLWERAGGKIDDSFNFAGDFELWGRFFENAQLYAVDVPLACFRKHDSQKSSAQFAAYLAEAKTIFSSFGGKVPHTQIQSFRVNYCATKSDNKDRSVLKRHYFKPTPIISYAWQQSEWKILSF